MRFTRRQSAITFGVFLVFGIGFLAGKFLFPERIIVRESTAKNEAAETSVNLMLSYGNGIMRTWNTVTIAESTSVLDLLDQVSATGAINIGREKNDKGMHIVSIDAVTNDGNEGKRWKYWVNNVEEPRSIDKYYLKPGDIVVVAYAKE
jgi:hypothetical protein